MQARGLASSSGKEANFIPPMSHRCSSRAQLIEPTVGPDFVEAGAYALPYVETLMPRWKKLTAGSMPAPIQFSNFEESVLAGVVLDGRVFTWRRNARFLSEVPRAFVCAKGNV
jgi:hypothetical protein